MGAAEITNARISWCLAQFLAQVQAICKISQSKLTESVPSHRWQAWKGTFTGCLQDTQELIVFNSQLDRFKTIGRLLTISKTALLVKVPLSTYLFSLMQYLGTWNLNFKLTLFAFSNKNVKGNDSSIILEGVSTKRWYIRIGQSQFI